MNISEPFIRRPVATTLLTIAIILAGAVVVGDGRAVSSGTSAGVGVSAVSARVPGSDANRASGAGSASTDSGDGVAIPLVIGIGVLAAMGGFAAAFVLRRKSTPS